MTIRNAVFTGSAGAPWPALDTGDTWSVSEWMSPPVDVVQVATPMAAILSSVNTGQLLTSHNRQAQITQRAEIAATTAASVGGKYTTLSTLACEGVLTLIFVATTATYPHTHVINGADCGGAWTAQTFTQVATVESTVSGTSRRLTVFRLHVAGTPTVSGAVVVSIIDTATGLPPATQATGCVVHQIGVSNCDNTSNGANAVRTAQTVTATGASGQPTVTLASNLLRYSSLPMLFCAHATTDTATSSSNSTLQLASSYATPALGVATYQRTIPTTVATVKTQQTMTAAFPGTTTPWAAIGIELLCLNTSDTYTNFSRDYTYMQIASNTSRAAYRTAEVRSVRNTQTNKYGPLQSLVGRYVVSGGTKYTLYCSLLVDYVKSGYGLIGVGIDNGTTTTYSTVSATATSASIDSRSLVNNAMRVRVLANGDLWVSAKWWNAAVSEPAWPAASGDANSFDSTMVIANGVYSTSNVLRNATSGAVGLMYTYAATNGETAKGVGGGVWLGPSNGPSTSVWSVFNDDAWVVSGTASASASGSLAADASRVRLATASATASGSLTASADRVVDATATLTATGSLTASATKISIATASLTSSASLTANATKINIATASASATSSLVASAIAIKVATAAAVATSSLVASASRIRLATATATATGSLVATAIVITPSTQTLPVPITVSLVSGMEAALGSGMLASLPNAPFEAALRLHL